MAYLMFHVGILFGINVKESFVIISLTVVVRRFF